MGGSSKLKGQVTFQSLFHEKWLQRPMIHGFYVPLNFIILPVCVLKWVIENCTCHVKDFIIFQLWAIWLVLYLQLKAFSRGLYTQWVYFIFICFLFLHVWNWAWIAWHTCRANKSVFTVFDFCSLRTNVTLTSNHVWWCVCFCLFAIFKQKSVHLCTSVVNPWSYFIKVKSISSYFSKTGPY